MKSSIFVLLVALMFVVAYIECATSAGKNLRLFAAGKNSKAIRDSSNYSDEQLLELFRSVDANRDQYISAEEFHLFQNDLGEKLTSEDIESLMREGDIDGDNRISYEEFLQAQRT